MQLLHGDRYESAFKNYWLSVSGLRDQGIRSRMRAQDPDQKTRFFNHNKQDSTVPGMIIGGVIKNMIFFLKRYKKFLGNLHLQRLPHFPGFHHPFEEKNSRSCKTLWNAICKFFTKNYKLEGDLNGF